MAERLRLAVLWDWQQDATQLMTWEDGLYAALQELIKRGHDVELYTLCDALEGRIQRGNLSIRIFRTSDELEALLRDYRGSGTTPDAILHWADMTRPNADIGRKLGVKQAICFAGGDPFGSTWQNFDHIFVESEEYYEKYKQSGLSVSRAFGANTRLYDPSEELVSGQDKCFDICFPATFAAWKRHNLFAESTQGLRTTCFGYMYSDHETECWKLPRQAKALVLPHLPGDAVRHMLAASRVCLITSANNGGSQRTVLEAMAMNVPVIVMNDSRKTMEYVKEAQDKGYHVGAIVSPEPGAIREAFENLKDKPANGRDYVLSHWSHINYADQIDFGINQLVRPQ